MTDQNLKQSILDELNWEPSVKAAHIGVSARNGVVTLTGHVDSYPEKWAAERCAQRVSGVKAVAEELEVRYAFSAGHADDEIAKRALQVLSWDILVPKDTVKIKVEKGWVTLTGDVNWFYQKLNAEADVHKLHGVVGVSNDIMIKPSVQPADVRGKIETAFGRNAQIEAKGIAVTAEGGKVTLRGNVESFAERNIAANTAWSAPGVTTVENLVTVD
jgi:osmotically-inducible protein OsmY